MVERHRDRFERQERAMNTARNIADILRRQVTEPDARVRHVVWTDQDTGNLVRFQGMSIGHEVLEFMVAHQPGSVRDASNLEVTYERTERGAAVMESLVVQRGSSERDEDIMQAEITFLNVVHEAVARTFGEPGEGI
jgi:hypothetical protein